MIQLKKLLGKVIEYTFFWLLFSIMASFGVVLLVREFLKSWVQFFNLLNHTL